MNRLTADVCLLLAAAIWGTAFIAQKSAMSHLDPTLFVAFRGAVASLCLLPMAAVEARRRTLAIARGETAAGSPRIALLPLSMIAGLLFFVGAWLQQAGIVTASVTNTSFLTVLYTVFTPLLAWLFLKREPPKVIWPAVGLSLVGTWLLGGGGLEPFGFGEFLVFVSAIFWAAHIVVCGAAPQLGLPITFNALQFAVVSVLAFLAAASQGLAIDWGAVLSAWRELLYVGVLSSAVTFTLLTVALRHTSPGEAAVLVSSETVFAAAAAYWLLGERLTVLGWTGATFILGSVLLVQLGPVVGWRKAWR